MNVYLESRGIRISTGHDRGRDHYPCAVVDQERSGERDPRCIRPEGQAVVLRAEGAHRRGRKQGAVHSVCTSAASVADKHMLPDLLHGDERKVWGDGGYQGQSEAIREAAPQAQDMTCRRTKYKDYVDEEAKRRTRPRRE